MAFKDRSPARALAVQASALDLALAQAPYRFDFFQALRAIECAYPDKPRLGDSARPVDDPVRLGQEPSLAFANATLATFEPAQEGRPARLISRFFGLLGPNGPLPLHLSEYARDRLRHHADPTFARFLDLFHHRMLALFYRAWANSQPVVSLDRPEADRFGVYLASLIGLGMEAFRDRDAMPDPTKLHFAGRLALQTKNAEGLEAIVGDLLKVPVRVDEFMGEWLELSPQDCWQLGATPATGALGHTAILGTKVWEAQYTFRLNVGPVSFDDYLRLLPGGVYLRMLTAIVRNYLGDEWRWDLKLILAAHEVPPLHLMGANRLGLSTWLNTRPADTDADDLVQQHCGLRRSKHLYEEQRV